MFKNRAISDLNKRYLKIQKVAKIIPKASYIVRLYVFGTTLVRSKYLINVFSNLSCQTKVGFNFSFRFLFPSRMIKSIYWYRIESGCGAKFLKNRNTSSHFFKVFFSLFICFRHIPNCWSSLLWSNQRANTATECSASMIYFHVYYCG